MLIAHSDVVPADRSQWSVDIFAGIEKNGYVYGRGGCDLGAVTRAFPAADPRGTGPFRKVAERHGLSVRVYETAAGYRLAVTNIAFQAGSSETEAILREFGCDPLYIRLCRQQDSFRARLTPKPWRCGCFQLNVRFPFETPDDESRYHRWEANYNSKCSSYAMCRYVAALGAGIVAPEFSELIRHHDRETKSTSALPLA